MTATTSQDHAPLQVIHHTPGDRPLCGEDSRAAVYSDDPGQVAGCDDCLELVSEDLQDHNEYPGHCLHCRQEISAQGGVEWRRGGPAPLPALRPPGRVSRRSSHGREHYRFPRPTS